ncbi:hypothetical protein A4H34_09065 [Peptidiphaga gingivicola]|uniref:Siderophore-interacting FAD-binding domain-containing protein n=1 Tax=Peptidiphaga gingivicola TaxID=2741497 RepID=A0A179B164_9ACTO|nr:hypothetical protein A4H34_09065 [Peptidiphaga gingivicola]
MTAFAGRHPHSATAGRAVAASRFAMHGATHTRAARAAGDAFSRASQIRRAPHLGAKGLNIRAKLDAIDKADRPELRWCTVRGHDAERGMLTFDVVTHGESGPGSAWALHAQTGDEVGIRAMTSTWRRKAGIQLLVADSTSAPAMRGLLEACTDAELAATHVRIAAPSPTCWSLGTIRSDRNWPPTKSTSFPKAQKRRPQPPH